MFTVCDPVINKVVGKALSSIFEGDSTSVSLLDLVTNTSKEV